MKCSVCAKEVPAEAYAEHLSTEHGVTDDPGAVLLEHLAEWDTHDAARGVPLPVAERPPEEPPADADPTVPLHEEDAAPPTGDRQPTVPLAEQAVAPPSGGGGNGGDVGAGGAVPPLGPDDRRRRRSLAVWLIGALVLIGAIVTYAALQGGGGGSKHVASKRSAATTVVETSTAPDVSAGEPQTQVPPTSEVPVTQPAAAPTPAALGPDPATQLSFAYADASGCVNGLFDVRGSITNHNPAVYSIDFLILVFGGDGSVAGTASVSVPHVGAGQTVNFDPTGSCGQSIAPHTPETQLKSVTPG